MPYLPVITTWSAFNKNAALIFISLLFTTTAYTQILKPVSEQVWLDQGKNPGTSVPVAFVGNYPVIDLGNLSLSKDFNTVCSRKLGTLFMVIRPEKDSLPSLTGGNPAGQAGLPGKRLLKLGRISLYRDSVLVDGQRVDINPIKDEPVIIKVQYQGRSGRRWFSKQYDISPSIDLAELLYYETMLSEHQARIIESFLALKYSINITANSDPELRDYRSLYDEKVWNVKTDSLYDEEVLGLGRLDQAGFYQSQTMTADSKHIKVSLDSAWNTGGMPGVSIGDSSLLVLSKGNSFLNTSPCGGSPTKHLWKLKLFNWNSLAQTLRVETDSLSAAQAGLPAITNPVITNGQNSYPVQLTQYGQHTILEIPLAGLSPEWDYFITATDTTPGCAPVYSVAINPCDSNLINTLTINLSTLPANFKLINLSNGSSLEKTITASVAQVSGLEAGQYELLLSNPTGMILDSVFVLEPCDSSGTVPELSVEAGKVQGNKPSAPAGNQWVFEEADPTAGDDFYASRIDLNVAKKGGVSSAGAGDPDENRSISIFPNPAKRHQEISIEFSNLKEEPFTIQVIDSKGALLKEESFTPSSETAQWHYSFPQAGTYLLRAFSRNYLAAEQVIVQSTDQ